MKIGRGKNLSQRYKFIFYLVFATGNFYNFVLRNRPRHLACRWQQ